MRSLIRHVRSVDHGVDGHTRKGLLEVVSMLLFLNVLAALNATGVLSQEQYLGIGGASALALAIKTIFFR